MTIKSRKAVAAAAAGPAELSALLDKLDDAALKLGKDDQLKAWIGEHAEVLQYASPAAPNPRPGAIARGLCELFAAAHNLEHSGAAAGDYLRREAATLRQKKGQRAGTLFAAVSELRRLNAEGVVTDAELHELGIKLDAICARVPSPDSADEPMSDGRTLTTTLGGLLMSLTRAIGYGRGHQFSATRAAETVSKIMGLYAFPVSSKRLQNLNSRATP